MSERRRHRRVTFQIPATLLIGPARAQHAGTVMDIGEGGVFVMMTDRPAIGPNATVRFELDADTVCEATGWVRRVIPAPRGQGVGIEFGVANEVLLHYLRNLVAAPEADRARMLGDIRDVVIQLS